MYFLYKILQTDRFSNRQVVIIKATQSKVLQQIGGGVGGGLALAMGKWNVMKKKPLHRLHKENFIISVMVAVLKVFLISSTARSKDTHV